MTPTNADLVALLKRLGKADEVNLRDWREIQDLLTVLRSGAVVLVPGERTYEAGWEARGKRDAEVARAETVSERAKMPSQIILRVLAHDTAYVEQAIIAAVIATMNNIAERIERDGK